MIRVPESGSPWSGKPPRRHSPLSSMPSARKREWIPVLRQGERNPQAGSQGRAKEPCTRVRPHTSLHQRTHLASDPRSGSLAEERVIPKSPRSKPRLMGTLGGFLCVGLRVLMVVGYIKGKQKGAQMSQMRHRDRNLNIVNGLMSDNYFSQTTITNVATSGPSERHAFRPTALSHRAKGQFGRKACRGVTTRG